MRELMGKFQCLPRGWCDETYFVKNCFIFNYMYWNQGMLIQEQFM